MSNWEKQIEDHVKPGALSSCVYYGKTRSLTPAELKRYDVVITTYQTVTQEHDLASVRKGGSPAAKKRKTDKGLFDVAWKVLAAVFPLVKALNRICLRSASSSTKVITFVIQGRRWLSQCVR